MNTSKTLLLGPSYKSARILQPYKNVARVQDAPSSASPNKRVSIGMNKNAFLWSIINTWYPKISIYLINSWKGEMNMNFIPL